MQLIVRSAHEVVAHVVQSNPTIESVTLVTYIEGPNWRGRPACGDKFSGPLILDAIQQDRGERLLTSLSRAKITEEYLRDAAEKLSSSKLLGLVSKVHLADGRSAHIPMMDFICAPSTRNLEMLVRMLRSIRKGKGWLLESGRSYHYYGCQLLTAEEWLVFLGKCLLMSGYADDRYIGHQLVDGHCVLRLSSGKSKAVPTVVAELS
jgi:hypothetical protein